MADLNAGIISGINPPPNLAQQQAQQAELAQRQAQTEREQQLAQMGTYELKEKQDAAADTAAAKQIFAKYGGDLEKARPEIMAISPSLGISLGKSIDEGKKLQLELATSKLAHDKAVLGFVGQQLNGVTDEPSYLRAVTSLHAAGIPTDDWPDDYDKGFVEQHQQVAMTVKEKLDQEDKRIDDARQLERVQREEAAQRETARHNEAIEAISANDKLTDNQRQAARDKEIARHDRAMEARPVAGAGGPDKPIEPNTKEYRLAQDMAYGKLTYADFNRMYGRAVSNANLKANIYDTARQLNPNFNPAAFEIGYKFASSPKVQQQLTSLDNVIQAAPDLIKVSDAAGRSGITALNKVVNAAGYQIGGKSYTNLRAAQLAFADELSGALGYGSATDMSREMGLNMTDPNLSPANFAAAINDVVIPFVQRKRDTMLKGMGVYGQPGGSTAADVAAQAPAGAPKEGATKPIDGFPGTEQTYRGGKWIRTK